MKSRVSPHVFPERCDSLLPGRRGRGLAPPGQGLHGFGRRPGPGRLLSLWIAVVLRSFALCRVEKEVSLKYQTSFRAMKKCDYSKQQRCPWLSGKSVNRVFLLGRGGGRVQEWGPT